MSYKSLSIGSIARIDVYQRLTGSTFMALTYFLEAFVVSLPG